MPVDLKNSETLKNLMRAFAGESQARNRYTFAASLCRKQQLPILESLFLFTAGQEKEHGEIFYQLMKEAAGEAVPIDAAYPVDLTNRLPDLLQMARHHEYEEFETIYPAFAETARQEGFPKAAAAFEQISLIEQTHGDRFGQYAELLESGTLFTAKAECGWMCLNCGHIHHGTAAPEICPVCSHEQGFFIRLEMAPWSVRFPQK